MGKRTVLLVVALLVAQLFVMAIAPAAAEVSAPPGAYEAGNIVLDGETTHQIALLGVQMQSHLAINEDGTLQLNAFDPGNLNLPASYLENYKASLQYINAAIKQGLFTVDENFQVIWPEGTAEVASIDEPVQTSELASGSYYRYSHGMYVYFSYPDVRYYIPYYGMSTAVSLASYVGYPHYATPYTYHFTYNSTYRYYYTYSYSCCGVWSYVPVSYLPYYSYGYYYPSYKYIYYWNPYGSYYYYPRCYY